MTLPYRENQYKNDPFNVLDHDMLKQKSEEHKILIRKKVSELCQKSEELGSFGQALQRVKDDLIKKGYSYIKPSDFIYFDRDFVTYEESIIMDKFIENWLIEKFKTKGFRTSLTNDKCNIIVKFSEK